MDHSLIPTPSQGLSTALAEQSGELLRPFLQEIYLDSLYIRPSSSLESSGGIFSLEAGQEVFLRCESEKAQDGCQIRVEMSDHRLAGWIPASKQAVYLHLMQAGKKLTASVEVCERRLQFMAVRIGITLVDY